MPTGLSLNTSTGTITGTPSTTTGSPFSFTVTATDSVGASGSQAYTVTINAAPSITTATLPNWTVGQAYSQSISETGGTGAITFGVSTGTLPTGLSLNTSTGAITGTPSTTTGSPFSFTVTATDSVGASGSQAYTVTINAVPSITTASLPDWTVGQAYSQSISETGGTGAITFGVSTGTLPTGLSLNTSTGAITGTPSTTTGSPFSFTVTATDSVGATGSQAYTVTINAAPSITTATLPDWTVGQAYSQTISETGGTGTITFGVSTGTLPTGLSLNTSTGAVTGTPSTTTGSPFSFTVTATDSVGASGSQAYTVTINAVPSITTATLPSGTVGTIYSQTLAETGGTGAITFGVTVGTLPTGLSLNTSTGAITGTPTTTAGSPFSFTISATDSVGASATQGYSVTINPSATTTDLTDNGPNPSLSGQAVSYTVNTTGVPDGATVYLEDASAEDATVGTVVITGGTASTTVSTLSVGTHEIFASYGGDLTHGSSTSDQIQQVVNNSTVTTHDLTDRQRPEPVDRGQFRELHGQHHRRAQRCHGGTRRCRQRQRHRGQRRGQQQRHRQHHDLEPVGGHASIFAVYTGTTGYTASQSSPSLAQTVSPIAVTSVVVNGDFAPVVDLSEAGFTVTVTTDGNNGFSAGNRW